MIDSFSGEHRYLSNFWTCSVVFEGTVYPSVENAYQAAKTLDHDIRKRFYDCSAFEAKKRGYKVELRQDWDDVKLDIMYQLVKDKFTRDKTISKLLTDTSGIELVEGNHWGDVFWGVCRGKGENHLGKILMQVRAELLSTPTA